MKHTLPVLIITLLWAFSASAQSALEREGDDAFASGYYKTAMDLYKQAARKHPSPDLTYKMGDASRMANLYANAIGYYREIAQSPECVDFPDLYFHLATMYKSNGQVDSALFFYNRYLASFPENDNYEKRSIQETRACEWINDSVAYYQSTVSYGVTHEGKNINTPNSESGAILIGDTMLLFSSIQEISKPGSKNAINSDLVLMQLYEAPVSMAGKPGPSEPNTWGLNSKELHTGNAVVDQLHGIIYFNRCRSDNFSTSGTTIPCDLYYSVNKNGKWQKAKKVGGDVNLEEYSTTQPTVGYLPDSTTILYFASDRPGGLGGFDIWYTLIPKDGGDPMPCINLGIPVNSCGNEITPFYDNINQRLYFSSDWHYGFGGYDVFYSKGNRDTWEEPQNLGSTLNSPANDIYFTVNQNKPNTGYFTSNRKGSYYITGNTCCNDIYRWKSKKIEPRKKEEKKVEVYTPLKGAVHNLLPISLYFHNDEPDPKSELFTTKQNYFNTYNRYMFMRQTYKNAFAGMEDPQARDSMMVEIDNFFDHEVHDNCQRFEEFINLLMDDLKNGRRVSLTVEGYASPVHTGKYNEKISARRINSLVNQLLDYNHGALRPFIGSKGEGSLQIREVAYGSTKANRQVSSDRNNARSSVYSIEASRERRIELLDYQYLEDDSTLISCLKLPTRAIFIGSFKRGETTDITVRIPHNAAKETILDYISVGNPDVKVIGYNKIMPGNDLVIYLKMDNRRAELLPQGFLPLTLRVKDEQVTQTMFLEYEIVK